MYEYQYLISCFLSIAISIYLLFKHPKTLALKFLILFGFTTSAWEISTFMYRVIPVADYKILYFRAMMIASHFVLPLYLLTIVNIRNERNSKILTSILIPAIIQSFLICGNDYVFSFEFIHTKYGWAYRIVRFNPSLIIDGVIFIGYTFGILLSLAILMKKTSIPILKKKYLVLFSSFFSFYICGVILTNALMGLGFINSSFLLGGLFKFLTFVSILYILMIKGEKIPSLFATKDDFSQAYSSFLTIFYNSVISNQLGEETFKFTDFIKRKEVQNQISFDKDKIIFRGVEGLNIPKLINSDLKFFDEIQIDEEIVDHYLRVLNAANRRDLSSELDILVKENEDFLKKSDLIYGVSMGRFLGKINEDKSLEGLDDVYSCLKIYKRILLSILSISPELIIEFQKRFSEPFLSEIFEISDYGEVSIKKFRNEALRISKKRELSKIIDEVNRAISESFEHLIESEIDIDFSLFNLKQVLKLNKEKAEALEIYPKLLGTLATKIPRSQIHKLYSDYLEELVEEKTRELKKAQEDLLRSQRLAAIGEAAAIIGHDIRNPLQAIIYSLYLAKKELESSPNKNLKEVMDAMEKQVRYINKIVSDLQYYAKPLKPSIRRTNLVKVIEEIISMMKIPGRIKVEIGIEDFFTDFPTDPVLIRRVLMNLIMNAIQAMENGGLLRIRAHKEGDYALISIRDTGIGIPEECHEKIFQPLFTTKSKGQGLGLTVCKRIVEALHGEISFKSKVGKGTTFTIKLPIKIVDQQVKAVFNSSR
ncbi:MAG: sensor histidine kinase [Candidatus Njordarchaeales archaeon]